jgi:hypothetical protein
MLNDSKNSDNVKQAFLVIKNKVLSKRTLDVTDSPAFYENFEESSGDVRKNNFVEAVPV